MHYIFCSQIYRYVEVDLDEYYWDILPREKATDFINTLTNQLGQPNVSHSHSKVQKLRGSYQQLEAIRESILKYVGIGKKDKAAAIAEESEVTARSIELTNIPFITDDTDKLVEDLRGAIDQPGKVAVDDVVPRIKGNMQKAIVIFQSVAGNYENSLFQGRRS